LSFLPRFNGTSSQGPFGDTLRELDWSVKNVIEYLEAQNLTSNTLVMFLSDNGPWNAKNETGERYSGSQGPFLGLWQSLYTKYNQTGKFTTWEGGMRLPGIAYWPGKIPAGKRISGQITSNMDIFPTLCNLAEISLPANVTLDGFDLTPVLFGEGKSQHKSYFYYHTSPLPPLNSSTYNASIQLFAVRHEDMKIHFLTQAADQDKPEIRDPPLLFNLTSDPAEKFNLSATTYQDWILKFLDIVEVHQKSLKFLDALVNYTASNEADPCCNINFPCCRCSWNNQSFDEEITIFDHRKKIIKIDHI